jgi:hypothetical protein
MAVEAMDSGTAMDSATDSAMDSGTAMGSTKARTGLATATSSATGLTSKYIVCETPTYRTLIRHYIKKGTLNIHLLDGRTLAWHSS